MVLRVKSLFFDLAAVFSATVAFRTEKALCALSQAFMAALLVSFVFLTNLYDYKG